MTTTPRTNCPTCGTPCEVTGHPAKSCPDPQCGDSTWDHDCEMTGDTRRYTPLPVSIDPERLADHFETEFCKAFQLLDPEWSWNIVEWMRAEGAAAVIAAYASEEGAKK